MEEGSGPEGLLLRLVPGEPVFLRARGEGDDCRFAGRFEETWAALPQAAAARILGHWRAQRGWAHAHRPTPRIELLGDWPGRSPMVARGTVGLCAQGGHELRFWAPAADRLPDAALGTLIAHELGHVLRRATGWRGGLDEEEQVRRLVWEWGLDEEGLDDALAAVGAELRQLDRAFYAVPTLAREAELAGPGGKNFPRGR